MTDAATFWDKHAKGYAKSPISDVAAYEYTLGRTRSYLSEKDRVLEVGCGTGSTAVLLAANVAHITGTDFSEGMITIARGRAEGVANAKFTQADLFETNVDGGPFDVVLAHNVLHLIADIEGAVQVLRDHVKPGGLFISKTVCAPESRLPLKLRAIMMILPLMQFFGKAPYVNFMKIPAFDQLITDAGFRIIESGNHPANPPCRYVVARKL